MHICNLCSLLFFANFAKWLSFSELSKRHSQDKREIQILHNVEFVSLELCDFDESKKSVWKNQVRPTGFLVYFELDFYCLCRLKKINFEIDFCKLKLQFIQLDFSKLIFQNSGKNQQGFNRQWDTEVCIPSLSNILM